jgi:hypothetical protein
MLLYIPLLSMLSYIPSLSTLASRLRSYESRPDIADNTAIDMADDTAIDIADDTGYLSYIDDTDPTSRSTHPYHLTWRRLG